MAVTGAIAVTGARAKGFDLLAKDTGALIENFLETVIDTYTDYNDFIDKLIIALDSDDCLGISRGGSSFTLNSELRAVEFDGSRIPFVGDRVMDSSVPQIQTTLLEWSPTNLRRIIPNSDVTQSGDITQLRQRLRIDKEDYAKSLSWIRERSDGAFIIVTLFNPMNIESVTMSGVDKNEGELPVTLQGFNNDFSDLNYSPWVLHIIEPPTTPTP